MKSTVRSQLKRFVPAPFKRVLKEALLNRKLRQAVERVATLPIGQVPTKEMLVDLQVGWSNDDYAARTDLDPNEAKRIIYH